MVFCIKQIKPKSFSRFHSSPALMACHANQSSDSSDTVIIAAADETPSFWHGHEFASLLSNLINGCKNVMHSHHPVLNVYPLPHHHVLAVSTDSQSSTQGCFFLAV